MDENKRLNWCMFTKRKLSCYNTKNEFLGFLKLEQVGQHSHWCWYQLNGVRMSPGCLQEVRDKQKELFKERGKR